ncbi:TIGR01777 family oxidoreductase [Actinopolymorpha sp. B9G3]|uniref:TIGR01777 family oxidoreductase n=1 Tax=Actinopolymorpha sp. B9G3 TaxID=3158970 RepID=UPI0032D9328E
MRYVLAGASGFLGRALHADLARAGHDVIRLVRRTPQSPHESQWDPAHDQVDPGVLADADAVVNLAGANIGRIPWTAAYRQTIRTSRITTTSTLANVLAGLPEPPVFVAQSAIRYYGEGRGDEELTEDSLPGLGFLAGVVREWEEATSPAERAGVRVVRLRTGVVVDRSGGAFPLIAAPFRLGLGGRLGSGQQYMGMISLTDWLAAVRFVVERPGCQGAYNLTLPEPPTNAEFTQALGAALKRPTPAPVPAFVLRTVLGGFSIELLDGLRILPSRLLEAGFTFTAPDVASAVAAALHRS